MEPGTAVSTRFRIEGDRLRTQSKRSRLYVTRTANGHIEKNDTVLLADHPIGNAKDRCITVPAKELHSKGCSKGNAVPEINSHDKEFLKIPGAVPSTGIVSARLFRACNVLEMYQRRRYALGKNMIRSLLKVPAVSFLAQQERCISTAALHRVCRHKSIAKTRRIDYAR